MQTLAMFDWAHRCVPLLWLPFGGKTLAEGRVWPALLAAPAACSRSAAWGLARAYRGTLRFYQGGENKKPVCGAVGRGQFARQEDPPRMEAAGSARGSRRDGAGQLSLDVARPEVKMALATNGHHALGGWFQPVPAQAGSESPLGGPFAVAMQPFVAGGVVALTFFGLVQLMFNHFGFDRDGFRAIVLLPTPRRHILLGKNLALLPVALAVFAVYLGLAAAVAHLGISAIATACIEFVAAFLAMNVVGNLASILAPYRIAAGSLKPTKMKGLTVLLILATQLLFPLTLLPVFLPAGLGLLCERMEWLPGAVATPICAMFLAGVSIFFYGYTLAPLGRLLHAASRKFSRR